MKSLYIKYFLMGNWFWVMIYFKYYMFFVDFFFCGIIVVLFEYICILIIYCCLYFCIRWNRFVILFFFLNIIFVKYIKINDKIKLRGVVFVIVLLGNFIVCNKFDFEI